MALDNGTRDTIQNALSAEPGAVLEAIAKEAGASVADVVSCLPRSQVTLVPGLHFVDVMMEVSGWGDITFIVHTEDLVFEAKGEVPAGSMGHGFYNLHGKPIGGHLKAENCNVIAFVSRPLFSKDTHSVQFSNKEGGCMFKIYLGRDEKRKLIPAQVEKFQQYRNKISQR